MIEEATAISFYDSKREQSLKIIEKKFLIEHQLVNLFLQEMQFSSQI